MMKFFRLPKNTRYAHKFELWKVSSVWCSAYALVVYGQNSQKIYLKKESLHKCNLFPYYAVIYID